MAIQRSLNSSSSINSQGMQCGIGICVNAQVKIITMNAMNGYGGTRSRIQERVCVDICACVHVYVRRERKRVTVNMNISETVELLRIVQRHQRGSDEQPYARNNFRHPGLKPLKRLSRKRELRPSARPLPNSSCHRRGAG
jgi:hypothetical protein